MNNKELRQFCENELESYVYDVPESAIGNPWPKEKVDAQLNQLRSSIVDPYLENMELRDTYEQMKKKEPEYMQLWVVADDRDGYKVFYDPSAEEFGLATYARGEIPITIGVRGDFVGTFMAR